ncbi:hypothetical protein [Paraburkholderia ferrariae]|uniref:Uncharacterized protein n=1 Tax=Paraburkholderia ferrariae TaxID=386056 RepID=A0ABU9S156_9BURK
MSRIEISCSPRILQAFIAAGAFVCGLVSSFTAAAAPVTYTMFVVTDVSIGGRFFHNANVSLKFVGDTNDIQPFNVTAPDGGTGSGFELTKGTASLVITNGTEYIRANFLPNQILVSLDKANGGGGFSALVGADRHLEPAYPLALDGSSIDNPASDLVTSRAYTGHAWSCIGFPPTGNTGCADPTAFPLKTNRGDFFIYQPYQDYYPDGTQGPISGSLNTGILSVTVKH